MSPSLSWRKLSDTFRPQTLTRRSLSPALAACLARLLLIPLPLLSLSLSLANRITLRLATRAAVTLAMNESVKAMAAYKAANSNHHAKGSMGPSDVVLKTEAGDSQKCRSLVCDAAGIIIAEMVYRCMICNSVSDSITEARAHYQLTHMEDEEEDEQEDEEYSKYSVNNGDGLRFQGSQSHNASSRSPGDHQASHRQSPASSGFRNPLVPDVSLYEDNSPLPLKFTSNNNNNNNFTPHNNVVAYKGNHSSQSIAAPVSHDSRTDCSCDAGLMDQSSAQTVPGRVMTSAATNGGSNTKSGYVNCAVCNVTRFYSW